MEIFVFCAVIELSRVTYSSVITACDSVFHSHIKTSTHIRSNIPRNFQGSRCTAQKVKFSIKEFADLEVNCKFGHIYWRNLLWETSIFVPCWLQKNREKFQFMTLNENLALMLTIKFEVWRHVQVEFLRIATVDSFRLRQQTGSFRLMHTSCLSFHAGKLQ